MKGTPLYRLFNKVSAVAMILALLWLTISAPFVNAAAQEQALLDDTASSSVPVNSNDEEAATPLGNATEEKAGSTNLSEEYLHGHEKGDYLQLTASLQHNCEHADTYNAFHGELLVPPPNCA